MSVVPVLGAASTWNEPSSSSTRSRIPCRPRPAHRGVAAASKPRPSSSIMTSTLAGLRVSTMLTCSASRVLDHVRQRLLHDAVERRLDVGREPLPAEPRLDLHVERPAFAHGLAEPAERGLEAEVVEGRRAQLDREPPHVLQRLDDELAQRAGGGVGSLGALRPLDRCQAEQDRRQRLAGLVVELAREPPPLDLLGLHRPPQRVPLHAARVLDRDRRLRREKRRRSPRPPR